MELKDETVEELVDKGEIVEDEHMCRLHHSSLARLYVGTAEKHPFLAEKCLDKLKNSGLSDKDYTIIAFLLRL